MSGEKKGARAYIRGVGSYVPEKKVSNEDIAKLVDTSDEWIFSHTGIHNRHIAADNEAASDLAYKASRKALQKASLTAEDIDLILVATSTPDYVGFPSTASIVQNRLGATKAGAMDVSAACTGFIYAVETARVYIEAGTANHVLVIGSEVLSRFLDWKDRNTCVLFGDGAGAVIISKAENGNSSKIEHSILKSDGSGCSYLLVEGGGSRRPEEKPRLDHPYIQMNGQRVYHFAVKALCDTVIMLLEENRATVDEITYIVPHQANVRIINAASKRMGVPREKFYMNIEEYANTSAASIPLALNEMIGKNLLQRGDMILTIGFGGGLTFGGNLIHW